MNHYADKINTEFGFVYFVVDEKGTLVFLYLDPKINPKITDEYFKKHFEDFHWNKSRCAHVARQMKEYFGGERKKFDLKINLKGTLFQVQVWNELMRIPYGKTASYGDIAERIGKPGAARAIGQANHNNPIMIVVPCHRCIGADRKVKGAPVAISVREQILNHEGVFLK